MAFKKWKINSTDRLLAKSLSQECGIEPILTLIASSRGFTDPSDIEQFFSSEPNFSDIYLLADITHAAKTVNQAIVENKKIAIFGDYDCDGVTATAMLYKYLKNRGADCIYYIPDRFNEGYGMNCKAIEYLKSVNVDLIITVDNGIACLEEVELANKLGISVVITDHHLPSNTLPNAEAIVDPYRVDCQSEFKTICGAEVTFMLICVMEGKEPEELLYEYSDILAIAVIADVMPLIYENRCIVKYGIEKIRNNALIGFSALLNVSGVKINDVSAEKIAFSICPRINAAGRMGSAKLAVELLCENNMLNALNLANQIDELNIQRQQTEKNILNEAINQIYEKKLENNRVIVVCGENWHHGVVGIVASRICERFGAPTIVLSLEDGIAHGSGRSYDGFSLFDAINNCKDLLLKFGGHALACGLSLEENNIENFIKKINSYAFEKEYIPPTLTIDCKLNPQALTLELSESLKQLEPFGFQNQVPIFGVFGVVLERITPLSNNRHLKLLLSKEKTSFQALLFGTNTENFNFEIGDILDLAITVETNIYNGNASLSVQIKGIRISGTDEEKLFKNINNYNLFVNNIASDVKEIIPTREQIGEIYRNINENGITTEKIIYKFIKSLKYGKTLISLDILEDLKLVYKKEGKYFKIKNVQKTNLNDSLIYQKILKAGENSD